MSLEADILFKRLSPSSGTKRGLSPRDVEVIQFLAKNIVPKEIAAQLLIGESTVSTRLIHVFNKPEVTDRGEAVEEAAWTGIIKL